MIRMAKSADIPRLKQIWQICFGDSQEEIDFFFSQMFSSSHTLVDDVHGAPVSMLYLLDGALIQGAEACRGQYIYAAGTLPSYRGCGRMSALLQATRWQAADQKLDCLTLLPAERQLYGYYARFGFRPFFRRACLSLERRRAQALAVPAATAELPRSDTIKRLRAAAFSTGGFWQWEEHLLDYALQMHRGAGGQSVCTQRGYALFRQTGANAVVSELCADADELPRLLSLLLEASDARQFQFVLPVSLHLAVPVATQAYGMLLPLSERAKHTLHAGAYLGLALE